jgi:hypothetical protein
MANGPQKYPNFLNQKDDKTHLKIQESFWLRSTFTLLNFGQSHFFLVRKQPEKSRLDASITIAKKTGFLFIMTINEMTKLMVYCMSAFK